MKVLLVDGVGRARTEELTDARFLPTTVEIPLTPSQHRVEVRDDGTWVIILAIKFSRSDVRENGLPVYRMEGIAGLPAIRRGY